MAYNEKTLSVLLVVLVVKCSISYLWYTVLQCFPLVSLVVGLVWPMGFFPIGQIIPIISSGKVRIGNDGE